MRLCLVAVLLLAGCAPPKYRIVKTHPMGEVYYYTSTECHFTRQEAVKYVQEESELERSRGNYVELSVEDCKTGHVVFAIK